MMQPQDPNVKSIAEAHYCNLRLLKYSTSQQLRVGVVGVTAAEIETNTISFNNGNNGNSTTTSTSTSVSVSANARDHFLLFTFLLLYFCLVLYF